MLARLAAGLAHEIKNPLSTMAINLALLEEEWGRRARAAREPGARDKRCQKRVADAAARGPAPGDDRRRLPALRARRRDQPRAARPRPRSSARPSTSSSPRTRARASATTSTCRSALPLVMLDAGAFRQALLNLFVNARQAMPMGGELIVRVRRRGNSVELSRDRHRGRHAPEELEHCFDVYYSTKKGGTGLGLLDHEAHRRGARRPDHVVIGAEPRRRASRSSCRCSSRSTQGAPSESRPPAHARDDAKPRDDR